MLSLPPTRDLVTRAKSDLAFVQGVFNELPQGGDACRRIGQATRIAIVLRDNPAVSAAGRIHGSSTPEARSVLVYARG